MIEGMFIGTFLINHINPNDTKFKIIPIDGVYSVNKDFKENPYILILDGQQRLTSMFYALYEPDRPLVNTNYPYRFFVDLENLLKRNDGEWMKIEETVFSWSVGRREYKEVVDENGYKIDALIEKRIVPIKFLDKNFSKIWFTNDQRWYDDESSKKITSLLERIIDYQVMTIDVPINESLINIAKLFEKTNRTGIKLSVFDLLTARLYKFINVRSEWEKAFDNSYYIKRFVDNKKRDTKLAYHIIQAIVLHSGLKSIKSADILDITEKELNTESRGKAIDLVENKILKMFFAVNEFGIWDEYWISYPNMITIYLAMFLNWNIDIDKLKFRHRASIFTERYSWTTESKITKDYKDLMLWFADENAVPFVVKEARKILDEQSSMFVLKDKSYSGSAIYKWVINLLFMNGARDFYEKDTIVFNAYDLDDHHIFPKSFLENKLWNKKISWINYDTILNKTLIYSTTNRKISNKAPWDYIEEMLNIFGDENKVKDIFAKHFIDEQMYWLLKQVKKDSSPDEVRDYFDSFTRQREKLIKERVRALLGIHNKESLVLDFDWFLENADENKTIEFKSTLRRNMHQNCNGWEAIEHNVLKTISAFFNTEGWDLVIGIDDNKNIVGLEMDYNTLWNKGDRDWFRLHLDNLIDKHFWNEYQWLIDTKFFSKDGKDVIVVFVKKSSTPIYLKVKGIKEFYIRRNASSVKLDAEEIQKYISQHF